MKSIYSIFALLFVITLVSAERVECATEAVKASESLKLEVIATTMTQIVLQWKDNSKNISSFQVERATDSAFSKDLKSYSLDKNSFIFSDTDREPVSKRRFTGEKREPLLDPKKTYYYRIKANLDGGVSEYSNTVSAKVSEPVRGKEGDLWADIVLCASDFGENVAFHPTKDSIQYAGGVLIDKTVKPNRMYVVDCNNNRILGFESTTPKNGADIVLGQPNFETSYGNGDSCAQLFPYRQSSLASTLCFTNPTQISIAETVVRVTITVDEKGNLFVPDIFNNRVLMYKNPFGTDTVADEVWGQADFAGNEPNRGTKNAANNTIWFTERAAVALDSQGNLWVADSGNNRVLRFPKDAKSGVITKEADIVLGQADFSANGEWGFNRTNSQFWYPIGVQTDLKGNVYVCDGITQRFAGRILVFEPPFKSGMPATRIMPIPAGDIEISEERKQAVTIGSMRRDINPDRMWFEKGQDIGISELVDLKEGKVITSVRIDETCGIDVDSDGNLYVVSKWGGIFRFPASSLSLPWQERKKSMEPVLTKMNVGTAGSTGGILGITTFKDQLIIASNSRLYIWNKFNLNKMKNGQLADDFYGEDDLTTISYNRYRSSCQEDQNGRLWLSLRQNGHTLQAFEYPLTHNSKPVKSIPLGGGDQDVLDVIGGGKTHAAWADFIDFSVAGTGDKIWVADRNASRVFRINNVDGVEDPKAAPYVDIVLGQNNLADQKLHQGKERCGARTLAWCYNVDISPDGELMIADNGGECGTDQRILIYEAKRFPDKPEKCLFADDIGDPDRVIGTGGKLDLGGSESQDPICSPFEVGISAKGTVVAGMNGYSVQRFPLVYLNPKKTTQPQMALGDVTAYPTTCFIDKDGNVYIGDWDWSRVLIYKKPFKNIKY
jgi:sugar lactone lactonase YvrE